MDKLEVLEKLLHVCEHGDECGEYPNLTQKEIDAIQWAKSKLASIRDFYPELFLK